MGIRTKAAACGVAVACASMALGTGLAVAAPYTNAPRITTTEADPCAGESTTFRLSGFAPGEIVNGVLDSALPAIFSVVTNANGIAVVVVPIPRTFPTGIHRLIATGTSGDTASVSITVLGVQNCPSHFPPGHDHDHDHDQDDSFESDDSDLPRTGAEVGGLALTSGALLAGGTVLIMRRRRP